MKLLLVFGTLFSQFAFADLTTQMANIRGDWMLDKTSYIARIEQQTENSIRIIFCSPESYAAGSCSKTVVFIANYTAQLDGFYSTGATGWCSRSVQAGIDGKSMVMSNNPFSATKGCEVSNSLWSRLTKLIKR